MPVELIIGPSVKAMSRTAAERALKQNPDFPPDAEYTINTHAGHYIAAFAVQASPPFAGGGPADASEEVPGPKSEGPDDSEPSEDGAPDESKPEVAGPEGESKPGEAKGPEHKELSEIAHLTTLIQAIADALGVSLDAGLGSPVPGPDAGLAGPPPPPAPHPAGPPKPPGPPAGPAGPGNEHVIHEKAGPPPIPTFASAEDHPWAHTVGQVQHFRVAEEVANDKDLGEVESELQAIASAGGFRVARIREERNEAGRRVVAAIIATPQQ